MTQPPFPQLSSDHPADIDNCNRDRFRYCQQQTRRTPIPLQFQTRLVSLDSSMFNRWMLMLQVLANTPNKAPTPMPGHSTSINTNPLHTGSSSKAGKTHNHASLIENKAPNIESETVYKLKFPVLQHIQIKFP